MTTKTDGERLERVEANLENLTKLVEAQGKLLQDIKEAQLISSGVSATKDYVDTKVESSQSALKIEIQKAKAKNTVTVWITATLSAVFGAVMMGLITFWIANSGK